MGQWPDDPFEPDGLYWSQFRFFLPMPTLAESRQHNWQFRSEKYPAQPDDPAWQASHKTLLINAISQAEALAIGASNTEEPHRHFPGNRPSVLISWEMTTPYALVRLLALYEHITIVSGFIWGVNSFDQWGVEIGKSIASDIANGRDLSGLSPTGIAILKKMEE